MNSHFAALNHPCLPVALEAAQQAGVILCHSFRKKVSVHAKSLANFVSEVDLESEKRIGDILHHAFPHHTVLGEESVRNTEHSDSMWVVDPLDGTSNYLHGLPQFAISIAYVEQGVPMLGVIYNPASQEWFATVRGQGAWYGEHRMRVNQEATLAESLVAVGFYYDRGKMMEATLATIADLFRQKIHGIRRFGAAALDLAQVARGDYGAFIEYQLHPWDHAAGALMVQEAGGQASDCFGRALPLDGPSSVLASNGLLHPKMLETAQPHWLGYVQSQTA